MSDEGSGDNFSISLPVGVVASLLLLGLAGGTAYLLMSQNNTPAALQGRGSKPRRRFMRRIGLSALVTLIENDATRRVLVAALRALAKRS
jgi:hypothetical protein